MHPFHACFLAAAALFTAGPAAAAAADTPAPVVVRDLEYASVDGLSLRLDLHRGTGAPAGPLVVWVHGGAWRSGSRASMPLGPLVRKGITVASVDYRLSTQARFPAQIHDIKASIRFLRASAGSLGIEASRIAIAGDSAGAHLATLVGVSNGHPELEGNVGAATNTSSAVQAIVSFYGAANLTTILSQSTPHGLNVRIPALDLLLGGQPDAVPTLARLASPVFHVDETDPPLLLFHGDQDPQMPVNQSLELHGAYKRQRRPVTLEIVHGGAHGGAAFYEQARMDQVRAFLNLPRE